MDIENLLEEKKKLQSELDFKKTGIAELENDIRRLAQEECRQLIVKIKKTGLDMFELKESFNRAWSKINFGVEIDDDY